MLETPSSAEAENPTDAYAEALAAYCSDRTEAALYRASLLSQTFVESGLGPEDIIALHCESLETILEGRPAREQVLVNGDAQQFLLEMMIAYGVKYKEFLELRLSQSVREAEARSARERERARRRRAHRSRKRRDPGESSPTSCGRRSPPRGAVSTWPCARSRAATWSASSRCSAPRARRSTDSRD